MTLNEFVAGKKRAIYDALSARQPPPFGRYDESRCKDLLERGRAQVGTTVLSPREISMEFVFVLPDSTQEVVSVAIDPPERIVFLPVPEWVVESIWQGEIQGTYVFESEAESLLSAFRAELSEPENEKWFGRQGPKRRE